MLIGIHCHFDDNADGVAVDLMGQWDSGQDSSQTKLEEGLESVAPGSGGRREVGEYIQEC